MLAELTYEPLERYRQLESLGALDEQAPVAEARTRAPRSTPVDETIGRGEMTYDPIARYNALARSLRRPRGFKSIEHLRVLRASDPLRGTMVPHLDLPSAHELTYDPVARYNALARSLRHPRGFKSIEHLQALRQSEVEQWQRERLDRDKIAPLLQGFTRRTSDPEVSPWAPAVAPSRLHTGRVWRPIQVPDVIGDEAASELSAARTAERASNETIGYFLLDSPASKSIDANEVDWEMLDLGGSPLDLGGSPLDLGGSLPRNLSPPIEARLRKGCIMPRGGATWADTDEGWSEA